MWQMRGEYPEWDPDDLSTFCFGAAYVYQVPRGLAVPAAAPGGTTRCFTRIDQPQGPGVACRARPGAGSMLVKQPSLHQGKLLQR